jgi:hypothetical protein
MKSTPAVVLVQAQLTGVVHEVALMLQGAVVVEPGIKVKTFVEMGSTTEFTRLLIVLFLQRRRWIRGS